MKLFALIITLSISGFAYSQNISKNMDTNTKLVAIGKPNSLKAEILYLYTTNGTNSVIPNWLLDTTFKIVSLTITCKTDKNYIEFKKVANQIPRNALEIIAGMPTGSILWFEDIIVKGSDSKAIRVNAIKCVI